MNKVAMGPAERVLAAIRRPIGRLGTRDQAEHAVTSIAPAS